LPGTGFLDHDKNQAFYLILVSWRGRGESHLRCMKIRRLVGILFTFLTGTFPAFSQTIDPDLQQLARNVTSPVVREFYRRNNYVPAWGDEENINQLKLAILSIGADGLDPRNYNLKAVERVSREAHTLTSDLELTDAFVRLAHDLYEGQVSPESLFPGDWDACTQPADYAGLLLHALSEKSVCETLDFLRPTDNSYEGLKYMLSRFQKIKSCGGLPELQVGRDIKPGDMDERMASIITRLFMLGIIPESLANEGIRYDSILIYPVQKFQRLNNLSQDGIIGRRTQEALNLTADDYIGRIIVNLERYRWLQSRMLARHIQINIASAELTLANDAGSNELRMKVIIGRPDRRTPALSSVVTMLTINPSWTVPPTILKEDVLPAIIADRGYLGRHKMRVFSNKGTEVNADSVPWSTFTTKRFPYTLREDPGTHNPLGLIKFSFPNDHSVYLHDTNMPSLFSNPDRALSSGCIRIESPMALVKILLQGSGWTEEMVRDQIMKRETRFILLRSNVPIHVTYFTAYVENDELYLARDIYQYDNVVLNALTRRCNETSKNIPGQDSK